jgi:hypothetical protein
VEVDGSCCLFVVARTLHNSNLCFSVSGSISNIDGDECSCSKSHVRKVISGVVGAASSVTSIQVANLLRLFRIPQVKIHVDCQGPWTFDHADSEKLRLPAEDSTSDRNSSFVGCSNCFNEFVSTRHKFSSAFKALWLIWFRLFGSSSFSFWSSRAGWLS